MNPFQFVLILVFGIVLMALTYDYFVKRHDRGERRRREEVETENAELVRRLDELEDRVRVLERIVTDESSNLRDRFSEL